MMGAAPVIDGPEAFAATFAVSRETLDRLRLYADLLGRWSKVQDLIAPSTLPTLWHRHMADSAQLFRLAPKQGGVWLDVGSGAGFPGLVLAIMAAPAGLWEFHLVESNARKCAFLRDVSRQCGVPVEIHCVRVELMSTQGRFHDCRVASARALASLGKLLGLVAPFFAPTTLGLFLKGRSVEAELAEARRFWRFQAELLPSMTDPDGRIVCVRQLGSLKGAET